MRSLSQVVRELGRLHARRSSAGGEVTAYHKDFSPCRPTATTRPGLPCFAVILCLIGLTALSPARATDAATDVAGGPPPPVIAVLDFELVGDLGDPSRAVEHDLRLKMISAALREELELSKLYTVTDNSAAADLIAEFSAREYLHQCHGCELVIAERLGADQVLIPWVYRVSHLVLTFQVEIKDVATGRLLVKRAFSFRGDNDIAWVRAIKYFVRSLKGS